MHTFCRAAASADTRESLEAARMHGIPWAAGSGERAHEFAWVDRHEAQNTGHRKWHSSCV